MANQSSKPNRWRSRFGKFIRTYGTAKLARELAINTSTIYHWMGGASSPRPTTAQQILAAAKSIQFRLTHRDIYEIASVPTAEVSQ
jgi:DNA-binding phage protein